MTDSKTKRLLEREARECREEIRRLGKIREEDLSPATLAYTNYLKVVSNSGSPAEIVATILPCYWIYLEVAQGMRPKNLVRHPYSDWIKTYRSSGYAQSVTKIRRLANRLAAKTSARTRDRMLLHFRIATFYELQFWDDSFRQKTIL